MRALVRYPYRDRETGEVRYLGDVVELGAGRFAELAARGLVEQAPPEAAGDEGAARADSPAPPAQPGAATVAELRAAIEAGGGFAPAKATKAQLAAILRSL